MSPDVRSMLMGLLNGDYSIPQCVAWLEQDLQEARRAGDCKELRDYFAAQALPAIVSALNSVDPFAESEEEQARDIKTCTAAAYLWADAMMEARDA